MFTRMDEGTAADWQHIAAEHATHQRARTPGLVMDMLARLADIEVGFAANQLTHVLMTATLAEQSGAPEEEVLIALCHDMGKAVSIPNHGAIAAEMLRPYVSADAADAVYWHQAFQGQYYYPFLGKPGDGREAFRGKPWFALCERLVDEWDMKAFDPEFAVTPLEAFEPLVTRVFSTPHTY